MPTFKATEADPLDYDFAPYHDAKGTVPEPTDEQVARFYDRFARRLEAALGEDRLGDDFDVTDPMAVGALLTSLREEDNRKLYDHMLEIHAEVCGGSPSREAIEALPFRLRRMFYGAVQEWLRPEGWKPATND
jgi:hypothetical protein